ncbi:Exosomal 3'-5' exoribonuclease complex, subunit Rrp41 and related exoribonucleases [Ceraceosorus bombacis]|uniref:Exosomal 3'-5' exoribonuclease complex, subunit Rrp41 and related exoribonucleases n=1 Tax=Ceraceosorus bombacis TaxID=401625 RepID=A0A0N7LAE7_9BASI|nr:Exosomal 3'-5' exoribonuclease complex, subunit Rrp41 and related exoribonucleases [Ceraceosorus bombacis]
MSRLELLSAGQLRLDSRRPLELRSLAVHISPSASSSAHAASSTSLAPVSSLTSASPSGSARLEMGLTSVLVEVHGPRERRSGTFSGMGSSVQKAHLDVDFAIDPHAGKERRRRAKGDRRLTELANTISAVFGPVVHTHLYPRSEIAIDVLVEVDDGGMLPCAINATSLALQDAGIALSSPVVSLTLGYHLSPSAILLDLTNQETLSLPSLTLALLANTGGVVLARSEDRTPLEATLAMLDLAQDAASILAHELDVAARDRTRKLVRAMGGQESSKLDEEFDAMDV